MTMAIVASFTLRSAPATGACGTVGRREARRFVIVHAPVSAPAASSTRRRRMSRFTNRASCAKNARARVGFGRGEGRVEDGRGVWRCGRRCGDGDADVNAVFNNNGD